MAKRKLGKIKQGRAEIEVGKMQRRDIIDNGQVVGQSSTWVRTGSRVVVLELRIDADGIIEELSRRAMHAKTGKATSVSGCVQVVVIRSIEYDDETTRQASSQLAENRERESATEALGNPASIYNESMSE